MQGNLDWFAEKRFLYAIAILLSVFAGIAAVLVDRPMLLLSGSLYLLLLAVVLLRLHWGIYVLLIASMLSIIAVEVGPFTVRPDQLVTLILAMVLFVLVISGKRPLVTTSLDWFIISYLMLNVISSLAHAPDLRTSLQRCLMLTITMGAYFVGTQLIRTPKILSKVISLLIVFGVTEAIYGILSVILLSKGVNIGGAYITTGDIYATGTFLEGNIFGSFQMMIGLILLSFLFTENTGVGKGLILIALVLVLVASMMSFTRAAWLGFFLGSLSYLVFNRKKLFLLISKHLAPILIGFLCVLLAGYFLSASITRGSMSLVDRYAERVQRILDYRSGTGSARVEAWRYSIHFWKQNPILGNGTDSIKVLASGSSMPVFGGDYWIPNSIILALHDTGVIGLLSFCAIQIVFLWNLRSAAKRASSPYHRALLEGFFAAFIGALFAYIFTNAFWLVFIWVFMAIGISCSILAPKVSLDSSFQ
ncbi:O-antigen ligase family protein [bacterium]|nr:O-antigen ligase family protein [bacterium]MCI0606200.1 O-antigen ligase family protein [bacterium]